MRSMLSVSLGDKIVAFTSSRYELYWLGLKYRCNGNHFVNVDKYYFGFSIMGMDGTNKAKLAER